MQKRIKIIPILLVIMLIIGACRSNVQGDVNRISVNIMNSSMETEVNHIHKDGEEGTYSVRWNNDRLMLKTTSILGTHFYSINEIFNKSLFETFDPAFVDVLDYTLDNKGNTYFILLEAIDGEENIYLRKYTIDGKKTDVKWLNGFHKGDEDDCYEWKVEIDPKENVLVYSYLGYLLIDQDGEIIKEDSWEDKNVYNVRYFEDFIFIKHYINFKSTISKMDVITGDIKQLKNIPLSVYFDFIKFGDTVLMRSDSELFQYNYENESLDSLLRWSDYGIIGDHILTMYMKGDMLHCIVYENGELNDISLLGNDEAKQKTKIVLGCIGEQQTVRNAVTQFNKDNSDYFITVVDYWNEDESLALNNMYNDILTGKGPDIIRMDNFMDDTILGNRGGLEDLNLYLDRSNVIGKKDIIDNIYDSLLCNGKLYMLPTNFVLQTMITQSKWVPATKTWNVDDIISLLNENPDIEEHSLSKDLILYYYAFLCFSPKVDRNDDTLDENLLRKYMQLADFMPDEVVYNPDFTAGQEGKILFDVSNIDCMQSYLFTKSSWGPESTFIGFPDVKGNGMSIIPKNCYGISAQSAHKEKAWEFIECFFTDEWKETITPNYDFSIYSSVLDQQFNDSMKIAMYNQVEAPIMTYPSGDNYIEVYAARENDIEEIKDMISGVEIIQRNKFHIINIIEEEAPFYFSRQKSLDDVINIIKNRVNLLLNE